jgi:hypothetical protein
VKLENEHCYEHVLKFVEMYYENQKFKLIETSLTINRTKESMILKKEHISQYILQFQEIEM